MGNSDSHAAFVDGVKQLLVEDVAEDDREFWTSLFASPMSVEDVFEIVSPDHIRQLRQKRPKNLQALLRRLAVTMSEICAISDETGVLPATTATAANTCMRLLTRIAPFLHEDPDDPVLHDILWKPGGWHPEGESATPKSAGAAAAPDAGEEGGASADDAAEAALIGDAVAAANGSQTVTGHDILYHIGRFLFLPGFTITPRTKMTGKERGPIPEERVDGRVVWKGGVGVSAQCLAMPTQAHNRARCEALRGVLALLSGPLFLCADEYQEHPPSWLLRFTGGQVCHTANLFCSLMSTVFAYDPIGWGLPYGGYLAGGTDEDLVDVALQVLCVVMDFDPKDASDDDGSAAQSSGSNVVKAKTEDGEVEYLVDNRELGAESQGLGYRLSKSLEDLDNTRTALWNSTVKGREEEGWLRTSDGGYLPMELQGTPVLTPKPEPKKKKLRNVYRYMLQSIHKCEEIDMIFGGIVRLLSTVHQASQTYLPNSRRSVGFYQEALVLLWHLVTLNPAFTRRVCDHLDTNQIVLPVLYLLQQAQGVPHLVGLLHTASFVLLVLSSERSFAVGLNEPYVAKLPLSIPSFKGCHADVVALTLYKVVSDGLPRPQNDALVEMLLTVLCNVSPYVKAFALESCLKLLSLLDRCARPSYLFRSPFTHHGLIFLIEMLNNIVQYQFEGNSMMVYSVLRQKEIFYNLRDLALPPPTSKIFNRGATSGGVVVWSSDKEGKVEREKLRAEQSKAEGEAEAQGKADGEADAEDAPLVADDGDSPSAEDGVPPNLNAAWVPTKVWLDSVKKKMPLQALVCLIDFLSPHVEIVCKKYDVTDQNEVLDYIKRTTLVGILPVPHPIVIRTYQASTYTAMWFTSYMWGVIFTRSQRMPLYDWKKIRLVVINQ